MASVPLPIEARKRSAFVCRCANPPAGFTNLVDPTFANRGIYARPYHADFLAVTSPAPAVDHHTDDMAADLRLFHDIIRPGLARRVVGFEDIQLVDAWAGHDEIDTFDQNGVIGRHPEIQNFVLACGLSGHGVMHAPAISAPHKSPALTHSSQTASQLRRRSPAIAKAQSPWSRGFRTEETS